MLNGKTAVLAVTGSIAAYKIANLARMLKKLHCNGQVICGFSMETDNVLENSRKKLASKNCDMICANSLRKAGAGFGTDTNIITLITADSEKELEIMPKSEAAHIILDEMMKIADTDNQ